MLLGRVIGALWGARHAEALNGAKLLCVAALDLQGQPTGAEIVAIDEQRAGPGDLVLVGVGSRVRDLTVGPTLPTKAVILAVVDDYEVS